MNSTAALPLCLAVLLLSGCAAEPEQPGRASPQDSHHSNEDPESGPAALPIATGAFVSLDGQTSGKVEVTLEPFKEPNGAETKIATVHFIELDTPYARLGVGGYMRSGGDDRCFDDGSRSGGGDIYLGGAEENLTSTMPAEITGNFLSEVVLIVNGEYADQGWSECMNSIVARAPLTWSE